VSLLLRPKSVWQTNPEYAHWVVGAEHAIKNAVNSGRLNAEKGGRAIGAITSEPLNHYEAILSNVERYIDEPNGGVEIARQLLNEERRLRTILSPGPGYEIHHINANESIADAGKYLSPEYLRDFIIGIYDGGLNMGTNKTSTLPLTSVGHRRQSIVSAHANPLTGKAQTDAWSSWPIEIDSDDLFLTDSQYIDRYAQRYINQKGLPQIQQALNTFNSKPEREVRMAMESILGRDFINQFTNPKETRKLLQQLGINKEIVDQLALAAYGMNPKINDSSPRSTKSWREVTRPKSQKFDPQLLRVSKLGKNGDKNGNGHNGNNGRH